MAADKEQLLRFAPISLSEMGGIRLMNRTDTKYVTDTAHLTRFLAQAVDDYRIQEVDGRRTASYRTTYLDTADHQMYVMHQCGRRRRVKIRIRTYADAGLHFFEVKHKDNHGRTLKERIPVDSVDDIEHSGAPFFLSQHTDYRLCDLTPTLQNRFHRITLVNHAMTERLTIDTDICFHNPQTGRDVSLPQTVIIELKRDGLTPSPARAMLADLHITSSGFSKYCIGSALTDDTLRRNRFKRNILRIMRTNGML